MCCNVIVKKFPSVLQALSLILTGLSGEKMIRFSKSVLLGSGAAIAPRQQWEIKVQEVPALWLCKIEVSVLSLWLCKIEISVLSGGDLWTALGRISQAPGPVSSLALVSFRQYWSERCVCATYTSLTVGNAAIWNMSSLPDTSINSMVDNFRG